MYLKSIEMQGFKSFAGKMKLDFNDGITAIVGPNGSGKSNISDAVRWVLGEQSAKQLRGGSMQDVIFAGTASRKPLGFASVSITFDNTDHSLNIDFEQVTIARRLFRSGESEYMINGTACRLRDIHELFYDTGIGKEGYSMIGQGQIDKILSGRPEERRELFDEAAGIVKFKRRKIAALKKLEKEQENMVRVSDILSELTRQVGPLERQSQKARVYLAKKEELKEHDLNLFVLRESEIDKSLEKLSADHTNIKEELENADGEYEAAKFECEKIEAELESLDESALRIAAENEEIEKDRQDAALLINEIKEKIRFSELNRSMIGEQIEKMMSDMSRHEENLENQKSSLKDLIVLMKKQKEEAEEKNAELENIRKKLSMENETGSEQKGRLINLLNEITSIKETKQHFITLTEQNEVNESQLNGRLIMLAEAHKTHKDEELKHKKAYDDLCEIIRQKEELLKTHEERIAAFKQKLAETDNKLSEASVKYHRAQSLLESLLNLSERYEGYGHSVKKIMEQRDKNPGIMGVVAEIISTDKKYETALETALGASLQNIVTDNESTAKYLIEFLKRGKYGRATFLPLTTVKEAGIKEAPPKEKGVIGRASELVVCEEKYKGLVNRLLGRTYVIDNIDNAIIIGRKYSQKYRMVTLEGELINTGGSMSGGSYKSNSNLLGRQRQIDELNSEVKKIANDMRKYENAISEIKNERTELRSTAADLDDEIRQLYLNKNTAKNNLDTAISRSEQLAADENLLNREKAELFKKKKETASELERLEKELHAALNREKKLEADMSSNESMAEVLSDMEREAAYAAEEARSLYNATVQKKEFIETGINNLSVEMENLANEINNARKRIGEDEKENSLREKELLKAENDAELFKKEADDAKSRYTAVTGRREELNVSFKKMFLRREEVSEKRSLLDKELFRLTSMIEKQESEKERFIEYLREEYEITPLQIDRSTVTETDFKKLTEEITKLKSEIKSLGNVNVNAIEEYKEVKGRFEFLSAQHTDLVDAAEKLKDIIVELDQSMRKQFIAEFANINKEFRHVFRELFGGGEGALELIDDEDVLEAGIRVIAQPPGKKLQNMMQLSGGEKTLTAIALLFAIQNLKPSPFVMLDEIEAALDDANVERFAEYLHKLSDNIQFIVITHRRGTMTAADRLYGITMQEKGISTMVSVDLIESKLS